MSINLKDANLKASGVLADKSTESLIDAIEALRAIIKFRAVTRTNASEYTLAHAWICEELERRNPKATIAWLDSDDDSPRAYFEATS